MANFGIIAGGIADTLNQGLDRNRMAQYQQQELQIQQQAQQQAQQRFQQTQYMKFYEDAVNHMQEYFNHVKLVGGDMKQAASFMAPTKENVKILLKNLGQDPNSFEGQWASMIAAPVDVKTQMEMAKPVRSGGGDFGSQQYSSFNPKTGKYEPIQSGEPSPGTAAPPGTGNAFKPGEQITGIDVQEQPIVSNPIPTISQPMTDVQKKIIQAAGFTPEQADYKAIQSAFGAPIPAARSKVGGYAANIISGRSAQYWIERGVPPEAANAVVAEFAAMKHGANTAATLDARMTEALTKAENTAQVVMPLANKVNRTKFKDFNDFMINARERTGNQDEIRLGIALETLATNYGISLGMGNSALTDAKLKQAQDMLKQGWDQGQLGAAVGQIIQELNREEAGTRQGIRRYIGGMTGEIKSGAGTIPSQSEAGQTKTTGGSGAGSSATKRYKFNPDTGELEPQ